MATAEGLIKSYRRQTGLPESQASEQLLRMLAVARSKRPRVPIEKVSVNGDTTKLHFANGERLRFSSDFPVPVLELPENKTSYPNKYHRRRELRDEDVLSEAEEIEEIPPLNKLTAPDFVLKTERRALKRASSKKRRN